MAAQGSPACQAIMAEILPVVSAVDAGTLSRLGEFLASAPALFFHGQGRSGLVARMAAMRFMQLGHTTHVVGDTVTPAARPGDALVLVSGSGATAVGLTIARRAREAGMKLGAVVRLAGSPLEALCDVTLTLGPCPSRQFGGTLFEQCALLVFDALLLEQTRGEPQIHAAMAARHASLE